MPLYKFKDHRTGKIINIVCRMEEIRIVQDELISQGYSRIYASNLIGFDKFGRSKK